MMVETKVGREGPPSLVSPIKLWAPSWWARKRSTVEAWGFLTPATVLVAMFFLIPSLLITYISFLDIEGSNFVDNPSVWLPSNTPLAGLLADISGGLWIGLSHKKLVHEHTRMPLSILARVAICTTTPSPFRASLSVRNCSIRPHLLTGTEKGRL